MFNEINLIEEISMNAHPAMKAHFYDGWVLLTANGYSNRANSVNMLGSSQISIDDKIKFCEEYYCGQNLPIMFKFTPNSPLFLDRTLEIKGYKIVTPTYMMTKKINKTEQKNSQNLELIVSYKINSFWEENFYRLCNVTESKSIEAEKHIKANINNKLACALIKNEADGKIIACGSCVVERGYAGLYDIAVDTEHRGKGYGFELCSSLLETAAELGARAAYLQVVADNTPAISLYKKLGYEVFYKYWYRVKEKNG